MGVIGLSNHDQCTIIHWPCILHNSNEHSSIIPNATKTVSNVVHDIHFHLSVGDTAIIQSRSALSTRKFKNNFMPNKKNFLPYWQGVWHDICCVCHFGRPRAISAILAGWHLPFWQASIARSCGWYNPPLGGEVGLPYLWGVYPSHPNGDTSSPLARIIPYWCARASILSGLPRLPTGTIMVSSPPL